MTPVAVMGTMLVFSVLVALFGSESRPVCPVCGSRVGRHSEHCPWRRRQRDR